MRQILIRAAVIFSLLCALVSAVPSKIISLNTNSCQETNIDQIDIVYAQRSDGFGAYIVGDVLKDYMAQQNDQASIHNNVIWKRKDGSLFALGRNETQTEAQAVVKLFNCKLCQAGTFSSSGLIVDICRPCPSNTFSSEGSTTCIPCLEGFWSQENSSSCKSTISDRQLELQSFHDEIESIHLTSNPTVSYRYFKYTVTKTRDQYAGMVQISELALYRDGVRISYSSVTVSNPGGDNPLTELPMYVSDGSVGTKWLDFNIQPIILDFGMAQAVNQYTYATANDYSDRDPVSWYLYGSNDGSSWSQLDYQNNFSPTSSRTTYNTIITMAVASSYPTTHPSSRPTRQPTGQPTRQPTSQPTRQPTSQPISHPSSIPTSQPTSRPTSQPISYPTSMPSSMPTFATIPSAFTERSSKFAVHHAYSMGVISESGSVQTWGHSEHGGSVDSLTSNSNIRTVVSTLTAFAALKSDGEVVSWGTSSDISSSSSVNLHEVSSIVANQQAFAALTSSGRVVTFGKSLYGGDISSSSAANSWDDSAVSLLTSNVASVFANACAFAALKSDGSVVTWGQQACGGGMSYLTNSKLSGVKKVCSNRGAFALIRFHDIYTIGSTAYGGGTWLSYDLKHIVSNPMAFVGLSNTHGLVAWGNIHGGGVIPSSKAPYLESGIIYIAANNRAFAALTSSGSVVTWGDSSHGGDLDVPLNNVATIYANARAFAALRSTGQVHSWGVDSAGGNSDGVESELTDVKAVYSTDEAFAALTSSGKVITWGNEYHGADSTSVSSDLQRDVAKICSNSNAFVALKSDGSVVTWGQSSYGGTNTGLTGSYISCFPDKNVYVVDSA